MKWNMERIDHIDIHYLDTTKVSKLNLVAEIVQEKKRFKVGYYLNDGLSIKKPLYYKTLNSAKKASEKWISGLINAEIKSLRKFIQDK
jgi:hypothetical protein